MINYPKIRTNLLQTHFSIEPSWELQQLTLAVFFFRLVYRQLAIENITLPWWAHRRCNQVLQRNNNTPALSQLLVQWTLDKTEPSHLSPGPGHPPTNSRTAGARLSQPGPSTDCPPPTSRTAVVRSGQECVLLTLDPGPATSAGGSGKDQTQSAKSCPRQSSNSFQDSNRTQPPS